MEEGQDGKNLWGAAALQVVNPAGLSPCDLQLSMLLYILDKSQSTLTRQGAVEIHQRSVYAVERASAGVERAAQCS